MAEMRIEIKKEVTSQIDKDHLKYRDEFAKEVAKLKGQWDLHANQLKALRKFKEKTSKEVSQCLNGNQEQIKKLDELSRQRKSILEKSGEPETVGSNTVPQREIYIKRSGTRVYVSYNAKVATLTALYFKYGGCAMGCNFPPTGTHRVSMKMLSLGDIGFSCGVALDSTPLEGQIHDTCEFMDGLLRMWWEILWEFIGTSQPRADRYEAVRWETEDRRRGLSGSGHEHSAAAVLHQREGCRQTSSFRSETGVQNQTGSRCRPEGTEMILWNSCEWEKTIPHSLFIKFTFSNFLIINCFQVSSQFAFWWFLAGFCLFQISD